MKIDSIYPLYKTTLYNWQIINEDDNNNIFDGKKVYKIYATRLDGNHYQIYYYKDNKIISINGVKFYCNSFEVANKYVYNFFKINKGKIPNYFYGLYFKMKYLKMKKII